jgi:DNA-binding SARP family transcriptional activator
VIAVRVLGPMEVTADGVPVSVGGPRQRCVLARLVAAHGRVVSVDRLIEDLYAGAAPPGAHTALQSHVSRLRSALEPERAARTREGVLVASPPGYAVRLAGDAVDAWSFESEVSRAAELTDPAAAYPLLSAALARWRGAAFEEFGGLPWADLEASRLAELRLTALEAQAGAALRLGRAAPAVADLERLTAEQPLREEGWRLLALALYQSGRQGEALAALRRIRELLAAELGVDPGAALRDLEQAILAQDPRLTAGAPALGPSGAFGAAAVPAQARPRAGTDAESGAGPAVAGAGPAVTPGDRAPLEARLAALPEAARTLLLQASVIGAETEVSVLGEVAGVEESILLAAVDRAVGAGLVTEPEPGRIRFADPLVRDTLYGSLSLLHRSRLHARVAAVIERRRPADAAALAHHYTAAGTDPVRAARYCGLAAVQAERRLAFHEAATLREQALGLLDQAGAADWSEPGTEAGDRLELVLGLVRALSHDGQLALAHSLRWHAVRAVQRRGDPELLARAVTAIDVPRVLFPHEDGGTERELAGIAERLLRELPPGDHPLRCRLLTTLAIELEDAETERGREAAAEALAMARRLGDLDALATAFVGCWGQSWRSGGPGERLELGTELLAASARSATAQAVARALLMSASCGTADFLAADWHAAEAGRIAQRHRLPTVETAVAMYRAMRTALNGDPDAAATRYRETSRRLSGFGLRWHGAAAGAGATAALLLMQDRTAELAAAPAVADWFPELHALGLAAAGRGAEARAVAQRPVPRRHGRGWLFLTSASGLLGIAVDDRDRAASAYRTLLPHAAEPAGAESLLLTLWPVAQILGDLAAYLGLPGADAHYREALAIGERSGVRSWRDAAARRLRQPPASQR